MVEFKPFPKMARLSREVIITEKLDGTNAQVCITDEGEFLIGSRTRWITPAEDNHGFARWATENKDELMKLGPGQHFGEWWGSGIQRGYGLTEKRFSLFNTGRWVDPNSVQEGDYISAYHSVAPMCCNVVPVLWRGIFDSTCANIALNDLRDNGSKAAPNFMNPEGIVIYHTAANFYFKKTIQNDDKPKSA